MNLSSMFAFLLLAVMSLSAWAEDLTTGLPAYDGALVLETKANNEGVHRVVLSAPQRISNELKIEKQKLARGTRVNQLLELTPGFTEKDAFKFYKDYLSTNGSLEFSCEQRACGTSNYWANDILNDRRLYGRDSDQYYVAGRVGSGADEYWVSAYIVMNGRKHRYVYLTGVKAPLTHSHAEWFKGRYFSQLDLGEEDLQSLKDSLVGEDTVNVWVVGFTQGHSELAAESELKQADKLAARVKTELAAVAGISEARIKTYSAGAFAPRPHHITTQTWFGIFLRPH